MVTSRFLSSRWIDPKRLTLVAQLVLTLAALTLVPTNLGKLAALAGIWLITFRKLSKVEWLTFVGISVLFAGMDAMAVSQGVFRFESPDFLGLPAWEFVMWGFYVLHLLRMVGGPVPRGGRKLAVGLAIAFAVPFTMIPDPKWLFVASAVLLTVSFSFFHERFDWAYAGYMLLLGALVEYTGVWSGLWSYPSNPSTGVPIWFVTMWGGIGLFTRRLIHPLWSPRA